MLQHRMNNFKLDYCESFLEEESSLFNDLISLLPIGKQRSTWLFGEDLMYTVETKNYKMERTPEPWLPCLIPIKEKLEKFLFIQYDCKINFNVCVIQQYPSGKYGIQKHRDKEMGNAMICGISLGQTRTLSMYKYNTNVLNQPLKNGSLYVLLPPTNEYFSHCIPTDDSIGVRFSLTFRYKS